MKLKKLVITTITLSCILSLNVTTALANTNTTNQTNTNTPIQPTNTTTQTNTNTITQTNSITVNDFASTLAKTCNCGYMSIYNKDKENTILTEREAFNMLSIAIELQPYDTFWYNKTIVKPSNMDNAEFNRLVFLVHLGVIDEPYISYLASTNQPITKEKCDELISLAKTLKESEHTDIPYADNVEVAESYEYIISKNYILNKVMCVPSYILDVYRDKDWTIAVEDIGKHYPNNADAAGICSYAKKNITIQPSSFNDRVIRHEFGHFLHFNYLDTKTVETLYNLEGRNLVKEYRDYSGTDEYEFMADAFVVYLDTDENSNEYKAKQAIPKTLEYLDSICTQLEQHYLSSLSE